jgi:hypothetical protein
MPRLSGAFLLSSVVLPATASVLPDAFTPQEPPPASHGDLGAFYEFHTHPEARDFGSGSRGEFAQALGVECRVLHDTAPVAQWIARPPPKGQVAGSIPARGTNSLNAVPAAAVSETQTGTALSLSPSRFPASTDRAR